MAGSSSSVDRPTAHSSETPAAAPLRIWSVVAVIAGAAGVAQTFGRFSYSLLLTDIRDDLGLSNTAAGALATANLAAYLLGTLVVSAVVSTVGLSLTTKVGILASTIGIGILAWSPSLPVLGVGQVITGFGGAAVWVTAPSIASAGVGPTRRGLAIGLTGMGIGAAMVAASAIEAATPTAEWRTVYLWHGAVAVVVVALVFAVVRDPGSARSPATPATSTAGPSRSAIRSIALVPGWRALLAAYGAYGLSLALFINFLVAGLEDDSGYSAAEAAVAFSAFGFGTVLGGPTFGPLSDRWGRREALVAAFGLIVVCSLIVPTGARPFATVAAFTFGLAFTAVPTGVAARVRDHVDGATFGSAFGVATLTFGFGLMVGPSLGGAIGDAADSFAIVFYLAAFTAVVGAAFTIKSIPAAPTTR